MRVVMVGPFGVQRSDVEPSGIVGEFAGYKGTVTHRVLPMAHALKQRGHDVSVVLPPIQPDSVRGSIRIGGIEIENLGTETGASIIDNVKISLSLAFRALEEGGGRGIIHAFKPKGHSGLAAVITKALRKLALSPSRVVVDVDDWEGYGGWNDVLNYPLYQKDFFHAQDIMVTTHASALTVASHHLMERFSSMGIDHMALVPNGPSPLRFKHGQRFVRKESLMKEIGIGSDKVVMVLYTQFRDFDVVAFTKVLARAMSQAKDTVLFVVGAGASAEEKSLRNGLIKRNISPNRIFIAGFQPLSKVMDYVALGDLALFPYARTNVSMSKCSSRLIDLMVAGLPIVASDVGENRYYLDEGAGLLARDDSEFSEHVVALAHDPTMRRKIGERARKRIWGRYEWSRLILSVEEIYNAI